MDSQGEALPAAMASDSDDEKPLHTRKAPAPKGDAKPAKKEPVKREPDSSDGGQQHEDVKLGRQEMGPGLRSCFTALPTPSFTPRR